MRGSWAGLCRGAANPANLIHMPVTLNDPRFNFEANPTLDELLEHQGVEPISDLSVFGGGWPDDEPVEEFLAALREWRGHAEGSENDRAA